MSPDSQLLDVTMLLSCRFIYDKNTISIAEKGDLDLIYLRNNCCLEDHMKKTKISSTRFLKIMFLPSTREILKSLLKVISVALYNKVH